jgi:putative transposase
MNPPMHRPTRSHGTPAPGFPSSPPSGPTAHAPAPDPAVESPEEVPYDATYFVQLRLADALPEGAIDAWRAELEAAAGQDGLDQTEARRQLARRIDKELNAGHGACWLQDPALAELVIQCLKSQDGRRYQLRAWSVVPNRFQVIVSIPQGVEILPIARQWRTFTAREAAHRLNLDPESFWERGVYTRPCRDATDVQYRIRSVEFLPVNCGLCRRPRDWRWGSAFQAAGPHPAGTPPQGTGQPTPSAWPARPAGGPASPPPPPPPSQPPRRPPGYRG